MSPAPDGPNPDSPASEARDWRPTAPLDNLRRRAELLAATREFFADRGVLEVETPLLAHAPVPDLHLDSFEVATGQGESLWLQTSPEYAMKRLLAAGSGPIYQLSKAFRRGEAGRRHNPEFTLLEWYRPGFDHHGLMDEVEAYLAAMLGEGGGRRIEPAERHTYAEAFEDALGLDPHEATVGDLATAARTAGLDAPDDLDRDGWLHLLLAQVVEPRLGRADGSALRPTFLYDFPASQAALARIRRDPGRPPVAERFEVFVEGIELANGFHELVDAQEQRRRVERDLEARHRAGKPQVPLDERFLAALEAGMPPCAGVALGFDRLVMLAVGAGEIADVIAFPIVRAARDRGVLLASLVFPW